jgi:hypothetical protein
MDGLAHRLRAAAPFVGEEQLGPSLLNVAECQNANAASATSSSASGFVTFFVSSSSPLPEHAPPSSWWNGKLVTSWHPLVGFGFGSPVPWRRPCRLAS